ncbi:hypothetical protein [Desulfonema magnum]|uniref:Rhomboid family protein n=1 Tax=Desulfonema magnum TaxID=45655 RepID=A0A975BJZ8_9BACT|nr:hypothetical protein [Desulfonema magnum]QTA86851.1 Uncharacterized protein dnm_028750 [Desulfonema magnum]
MKLTHQRCANHSFREAAARCPECGRYFCRECVTEHEDRVLCTNCLERLKTPEPARSFRLKKIFRFIQFSLSLLVLWLCFYYLGQSLISLPAKFHEGTLWQMSARTLHE